jgi:hypothetical protein
MSASVIQFRHQLSPSIAALARVAGERWQDRDLPMIRTAVELLDLSEQGLRAKVTRIFDAGADGLLTATDEALAETADDLRLLMQAISNARERPSAEVVRSGHRLNPAG